MTALPLLVAIWTAPQPVHALEHASEQVILDIEWKRLHPDALVAFTQSGDPEARARAARALGRLRTEASLEPLGELARDDHATVRIEAANALGQTPHSERSLLALLSIEADTEVRAAILQALGQNAEMAGMRALVDALYQRVPFPKPPLEARAAAEAMGHLAIHNRPALARVETVYHLTSQLDRLDLPTRRASAFALARMRPERADPTTIARLVDRTAAEPDPTTQAFLVRAVAHLTDAGDALPDLYAQTARDPAPSVRIATARAARTCGWTGAVVLLNDPDPAVRQVAIEAVAGLPTLDRAALLLPIVQAGDTLAAAEAQLLSGDPRLLDAAAALQALATEGLIADPSPWLPTSRPTPIRAAAISAVNDPDTLVALALEDPEVVIRTTATQRLVQLKPPLNQLLSLLPATDAVVAALAADAIGERRTAKAQKPLLRALETALDADLLASGLSALHSLYKGRYPKVRRIPESAIALARKHSEHPHSQVRKHARGILQTARKSLPDASPRPLPVSYAEVSTITSARIQTDQGEFIIDLAPEEAPITVWNFARLAEDGWFDGVSWHRIVPDFVAQTGDRRGDGMGGPGWTIPDEINAMRYHEGVVGMAHAGADTAGSQWFVTLSPQPHLNGRYTAFGHVTRGMHVVESLSASDHIRAVIIERTGPPNPPSPDVAPVP